MTSPSATQDLEQLKYPNGKLSIQPNPTSQQIQGWVNDIAALPPKFRAALAGLDDAKLDTPYRPGGWTVRQVAHHVPDSHLNAYIRVNWALTEDRPTIKPYNQAAWAALPYAMSAPVATSLDLLEATHDRWVAVMRLITTEQWQREYFHPEDQRWFKLNDLVQIYAWHGPHHLAHIVNLRKRMAW